MGQGGLPAIVRESGPWNHIKQKFATSVPGPVHSSSQDYQIPTSSQGPSNLVGLGIPQTSTGISWRHSLRPGEDVNTRDAFLRQYGTDITTYSLDSGNNAPYDMQVSHSGQVGQGGLNNGSQDQIESLRSSTSSPLQFPDLEMEDGPQQPSFSGDVLPRRSNLPTRSRDTQTGWRSSIMKEHDDDIPQNRVRESRQPPQLDDPSFLTPYGHPLHQQLTLKSVGYQFPYPEISGSDNPNHHHLPGPQAWTIDDRYNSAYNGTAGYTTNYQSLELDHPNAIRIPTTSDRYESDRPSSFPITAHFFPNNLTNTQVIPPIAVTKDPRRRRVTIGTPSPFSIQMQRKISSHRPAKASRSDSLEVIREDGQSLLRSSPTGSFKGRRTGPLSKEARAGAKQKRIERSVCIRCYMMKQKVSLHRNNTTTPIVS